LDLAVANYNSKSVSILKNNTSFKKPLSALSYKYDKLNRLTSVIADSTDTTLFTYDKLSRRSSKQYPNGVVAEYGYDKASQLLSLVNRLNADTISKYNYSYDPVGNRIKMLEKAGVDSFTYDVLYRLTGTIHPQPSNPPENFAYDGVGNRTTSHISTNYTYDVANRLIEDDQYQYRYDKNGNLVWKMSKASKKLKMLKSKSRGGFDKGVIKEEEKTAGDSTVYIWNAENTLLGFVEYHLGDSAKMVSYKYDGLGRRIEKKVDTLVTKYVYDNEDIIFELDGNDSVVAIYTHGPGIDEPISVQRNGGKYYYHQDGLGSVTCITDTLGNVINTYLYDSFGNIKQKTGGLDNPYTYTGREWDEESGLYYYRARYYLSEIGRFMASDPIGAFGPMSTYTYVHNKPTSYVDATGLQMQTIDLLYTGLDRDFASNPHEEWKRTVCMLKCMDPAGTIAGETVTRGGQTAVKALSKQEAFSYAAEKGLTCPLRSSIFRSILSGGSKLAKLMGTASNLLTMAQLGYCYYDCTVNPEKYNNYDWLGLLQGSGPPSPYSRGFSPHWVE
jgi:RHS repeat-associated protein